jgi:hypothetical protein
MFSSGTLLGFKVLWNGVRVFPGLADAFLDFMAYGSLVVTKVLTFICWYSFHILLYPPL